MNRDKIEELIAASKLNSIINKKEEEPKKCNWVLVVLAIIGAVTAYAVYIYFTPVYLEDFEDDFEDDDFDEDDGEADFEDEE